MSSCRKNYTTAIILAGGSGSRFESDIPKQFCDICGKTVLRRATEAFYKCNDVDKIVIVTRSEDMEFARNELRFASDKIHSFVSGGHTRRESAEKGFLSIQKETKYVAIHDAARCLISPEDVSLVLCAAYKSGAASAARRVVDTVKVIENGTIIDTVPRDGLAFAETPQVFSCELYEKALKSMTESITDDNMLLEKICVPITPVFLSLPNPKITTKSDLDFAEFLASRRDRDYDRECRIGQGYDVHRFAEGRKLILGGVEIPCEKGLLGHSDADVLVHAIMDALLGAAGLGDIGRHFPDTDEKYKGISSIKLLRCVADMINREGFEVLNVDSTVILEKPKISPHIEAMQKNISSALCISERSVNVKATTEEGLGFTGRGEGAKAEAVAMIRKK